MKKIICALCIGFFCTLILNSGFEATEAALANSVIRLHVLANSDSKEDQELKLKVRDRVLTECKHLFDANSDIAAARETVSTNLNKIKEISKDEIRKNGYDYDVNVSLGMSDFPTKDYGELVLPAGSYEALKIEIGSASGHNWWCVLFPPLCFVDETCVEAGGEAVQSVQQRAGENAGKLVSKEKSPEVELKFKAYEMWQNSRKKLAHWLKGFSS